MKVNVAVDNSGKKYGRGKIATVEVVGEKTDCRGIVLTKRVGIAGYALTHVNTGQAIVRGDGEKSKKRLLKIAGKLAKIDFNFAAYKTVKELDAALEQRGLILRAKINKVIHGKTNKEKK